MIEHWFFACFLLGQFNDGVRTFENKEYKSKSIKELYEKMEEDCPVLARTPVVNVDDIYYCRQQIEIQ